MLEVKIKVFKKFFVTKIQNPGGRQASPGRRNLPFLDGPRDAATAVLKRVPEGLCAAVTAGWELALEKGPE